MAKRRIERNPVQKIHEVEVLQNAGKGLNKKQFAMARNKAIMAMWRAGYSYHEIAEKMELEPVSVRRTVEIQLADLYTDEDREMTRVKLKARSEQLLDESVRMAQADYIEDGDGDLLPNRDKVKWHQVAGTHVMNLATLTGAKAASKIEINPGEDQLEEMIATILTRAGHEDIVEAEVIELEYDPDSGESATEDQESSDEDVQDGPDEEE